MINMQLEKNEDTINLTCSGDLLQRLREYAKDDPGIATIFLAGSYAISQILFMRREECRMRLLDSKDTFFDVLVQKRNLCDKNFYDLIKLIYQQKDKKIYSGKTDQELVLIGPYSYAENSVINKDRLNLIWFDNCFDDSDQRENPEFLTVEVPQMFQTPVEKNRLERGLGLMISSLNYLLSKPADEINKIHQAFISDQERIFQQFNDTQTPYPADSHIYEVFSVQVKKGSDRPALSYEGRDYSYGDLGKLVENRAKKLQGYGVGLGDIVSFIHKDKLDQIVSIFAILANGAAYLPIEPDYPDTRIRQMLEEALATGADNYFLLNDNRADKLQPIHQESDTYPIKYIYVDLADIDLAEITDLTKTSAFVVPDIPVDSPAYIMFTSGSTGSPKGVAVSHRNILRLVKNNLFLDVSAEDVFLQTSTVVFDASTLEIFCSLLNGAKFVLSHKEDILNASRLAEIIKKEEITTMWLSSPLFNTLCEVDSDMFRNLEHILIGGDALSVKHIKKLRESCPDLEIINGYGPTENTTFSCTFSLPQEIPEQIPVGQPIGNSTVYILDDELNILPVGSEGEICVGGAGVSLGYLNAEQLNQQKFVDNPFGEGKLFKTGDLGAWTEEGDVLFFGRMDSQMKINGYRVELSEIEFVAAELSGCDEVNVFVVDDVNDQKEIVLSYTGETGKLDLMQYLENNLPEFMLPHHYLHLAEFPLNQNGKLDRKRLMEIFRDESRKKTNSKSNMTELELAVFDILYGLDPSLDLAADTNLFSAGFDSLKLAMLLNRMQEYFHLDLQYQDIVKSPSISGLANLVTEGKATSMQIVRTEDKDRVLASEAQRRVFYASVEDSESLSYNIYALFQVNDVSYSDLAETFNHLVERHESLRSYFVINEGDLWQFFKPEQKTVVKTHLVEQKEVVDFAESLIEPFDLADPEENLFRLHWLETETSSYLLIDCHHIIVDGFSLDILIEDACSLLQGERLTNQEFKHRDYQYTKNIKLSAEKMESGRKFWTENLVEFEYAEDILPDYQKDLSVIGQEREGSDLTKEISAEYYEKILNFAAEQKISAFGLLLAVYYITLWKLNYKNDLLAGIPFSGRNLPGMARSIGHYVSVMPLYVSVKPELSLADFLKQISQQIMQAMDEQDYPYELILEELNFDRRANRSGIISSSFNVSRGEKNSAETILVPVSLDNSEAIKFDYSFLVVLAEDGVKLTLQYDKLLYKKETMENFLQLFNNVLDSVLKNDFNTLADMATCSQAEIEQIKIINDKSQDLPFKNLQELFLRQCESKPNNIALVYADEKIEYAELKDLADKLATCLRQAGVVEKKHVALMLEDKRMEIIAILAILSLAGVYIPIHSDEPETRIEQIIDQAKVKCLITDQDLALDFNRDICILLKTNYQELKESKVSELHTFENIKVKPSLDDPCYIMHTSGSTGTPKSVVVTHRGVLRLVCSPNYLKVYEEDKILQTSNIAFDASTFEIWTAFANGIPLVLSDLKDIVDPGSLKEKIEDEGITVMWVTASLLDQLVARCDNIFDSLRVLLSGGDRLSSHTIRKIQAESPELRIINAYGPTENTTFSTCYEIHKLKEDEDNLPIGYPISNSETYIVDRHDNLLPFRSIGELLVAGSGLAKGYFNDPDLTAEKFIELDLSTGKKTFYRTGDLAYMERDGRIIFLGRMDKQIKIRGYRIEMGAIERESLAVDGVNEAAVIVTEEGYKSLVLFYSGVADRQDIEDRLKTNLAAYMLPEYIYQIDSMPLTKNGKLDRKELVAYSKKKTQDRQIRSTESEADAIEVFGPEESFLDRIWRERLQLSDYKIDSNFFDAGGNSMLILTLFDEIIKEYGEIIKVSDLFANSSIREMAMLLKARQTEGIDPVSTKFKKKAYTGKRINHTEPRLKQIRLSLKKGRSSLKNEEILLAWLTSIRAFTDSSINIQVKYTETGEKVRLKQQLKKEISDMEEFAKEQKKLKRTLTKKRQKQKDEDDLVIDPKELEDKSLLLFKISQKKADISVEENKAYCLVAAYSIDERELIIQYWQDRYKKKFIDSLCEGFLGLVKHIKQSKVRVSLRHI